MEKSKMLINRNTTSNAVAIIFTLISFSAIVRFVLTGNIEGATLLLLIVCVFCASYFWNVYRKSNNEIESIKKEIELLEKQNNKLNIEKSDLEKKKLSIKDKYCGGFCENTLEQLLNFHEYNIT